LPEINLLNIDVSNTTAVFDNKTNFFEFDLLSLEYTSIGNIKSLSIKIESFTFKPKPQFESNLFSIKLNLLLFV